MMNQISQPEIFGVKFITSLCLTLQLAYLVPEEMPAFFEGNLSFPQEDPTADEIESIDEILYALPNLPAKYLEDFKA